MFFAKKIRIVGSIVIALFVCLLISGCGDSSDPEVSSWPAEDGYKIILAVSPDTVRNQGTASVIASVFDPESKPVADEEDAVLFSASAANTTFEKDGVEGSLGDIKAGTCQMLFKWEDESDDDAPLPSELCTITASFRGALATVQILLISKSY